MFSLGINEDAPRKGGRPGTPARPIGGRSVKRQRLHPIPRALLAIPTASTVNGAAPSPVPTTRLIEINLQLARPLGRSARRQAVSGPAAGRPHACWGPGPRTIALRPGPGAPRAARLARGPPASQSRRRSCQAQPPARVAAGKSGAHSRPGGPPPARFPIPSHLPGSTCWKESSRVEVRAHPGSFPRPPEHISNPPPLAPPRRAPPTSAPGARRSPAPAAPHAARATRDPRTRDPVPAWPKLCTTSVDWTSGAPAPPNAAPSRST